MFQPIYPVQKTLFPKSISIMLLTLNLKTEWIPANNQTALMETAILNATE